MFSNAEQKFTQDFDASPSAAIATELGSAGVEFGVAKEMISAVALLLLFLLPFLLLVVLLPFNGYCCGTQTHIHTCPSKLARFLAGTNLNRYLEQGEEENMSAGDVWDRGYGQMTPTVVGRRKTPDTDLLKYRYPGCFTPEYSYSYS
ncbi:unnamed protein product [Ceratitis capitata]|uniref:(Mediterranean fruit fly) hypothetical protein n=1 Tax=Ceratitis capitata TaxID=7213 RepID=A0A811UNQ2_CERCA|nr:unnamed protein product [Ceratitis capitata]